MINYDDFSKVELRVAKVLEASRMEGSDKLLKLIFDAGDKDETGNLMNRQVIAGIGKAYEPESLVGKQLIIVANLEPRALMGFQSNGMVLAASDEANLAVLIPDKEMKSGSGIK